MDPAIRWEVVRGRLPISIQLDQSEIASTTTPTPFFVRALSILNHRYTLFSQTLSPRVSYLPQILPGLHRHFETYCVPSYGRSLDPWMEYNGIPLDWLVTIIHLIRSIFIQIFLCLGEFLLEFCLILYLLHRLSFLGN